MSTSIAELDQVLTLARQLTPADQAQLVAHLAPLIASALLVENKPSSHEIPADSLAGRLLAKPDSVLARVFRIANTNYHPLTDQDIEQLREDRLSERYGV